MFDFIKQYYDLKLYTMDDTKVFVKAGWIKAEQYKAITDVDYVA